MSHAQQARQLDPIPEEITPTDHRILCYGGTSSNLERLPSRLQQSKRRHMDPKKQLEEAAYELSYLRAELQWQKETKQILLEFHERILDIFQSLDNSLSRATTRMHESERRYLMLWGHSCGDEVSGGI